MSSNVGLSTPRGSGTSGYVQRNLSHLRPRDSPSTDRDRERDAIAPHKARQPDAAILAHDRARAVEVQVFELREGLEDEGYVFISSGFWEGERGGDGELRGPNP